MGLENERLCFGKDEKAEQMCAYLAAAFVPGVNNLVMYDYVMRKFIKEKYGVEIENLAKKWLRLCWNCFTAAEELKMCSKCRIARYCGKNCQEEDWKVHKILHKTIGTSRPSMYD